LPIAEDSLHNALEIGPLYALRGGFDPGRQWSKYFWPTFPIGLAVAWHNSESKCSALFLALFNSIRTTGAVGAPTGSGRRRCRRIPCRNLQNLKVV
jgi:hypothetical protein